MSRKVVRCMRDLGRTRRLVQNSFSIKTQRQPAEVNKRNDAVETGYFKVQNEENDDEDWTSDSSSIEDMLESSEEESNDDAYENQGSSIEQMRHSSEEESNDDAYENQGSSIEQMRHSTGTVLKQHDILPRLYDLPFVNLIRNYNLSDEEMEFNPQITSTPKKKLYSKEASNQYSKTCTFTALEIPEKEPEEWHEDQDDSKFQEVHLSKRLKITSSDNYEVRDAEYTTQEDQIEKRNTINELKLLRQDDIEDIQVENEEQDDIGDDQEEIEELDDDDQHDPNLKDKESGERQIPEKYMHKDLRRHKKKSGKAERKTKKITGCNKETLKVSKYTLLENYHRKMAKIPICDIVQLISKFP